MLSRFRSVLRKPKIMIDLLYKEHLGIILCIPIEEVATGVDIRNTTIRMVENVAEIEGFYSRMNRSSVDRNNISSWLDKGYNCFLIYDGEEIVGGTWVFKDEFVLRPLSGRTLSSKRLIQLSPETLYKCYTIIDKKYRGRGLNQFLINKIKNYYSSSEYKKIVAITGAENGGYIRSTMKCGGKLIGITRVRNILGITVRKEIFIDVKEKSWR